MRKQFRGTSRALVVGFSEEERSPSFPPHKSHYRVCRRRRLKSRIVMFARLGARSGCDRSISGSVIASRDPFWHRPASVHHIARRAGPVRPMKVTNGHCTAAGDAMGRNPSRTASVRDAGCGSSALTRIHQVQHAVCVGLRVCRPLTVLYWRERGREDGRRRCAPAWPL